MFTHLLLFILEILFTQRDVLHNKSRYIYIFEERSDSAEERSDEWQNTFRNFLPKIHISRKLFEVSFFFWRTFLFESMKPSQIFSTPVIRILVICKKKKHVSNIVERHYSYH